MGHFPVSSTKEQSLLDRMEKLGIRPEDIEESFVRSSGAGGQHVNKTSTCVVLRHRPTGTSVRCQTSRSQGLNRFMARRLLVEKIEQAREITQSAEAHRRFKIQKQKKKRSRRAKEKILEAKHRQSDKKAARGKRWRNGLND